MLRRAMRRVRARVGSRRTLASRYARQFRGVNLAGNRFRGRRAGGGNGSTGG